MSDVTAAEIAEIRADLKAEIFPDEATVERPTEVSDGGGGMTFDWIVRETVPCRLEPYGGATSTRGAGGEVASHPLERLETRVSHLVFMPADVDVELRDRLEINNTTYEVVVLRQRGAWEMTRSVECKETP